MLLVLIYVRGRGDWKDFISKKNPLTPAGIEPATFRFVAQHLNHCATAVLARNMYRIIIIKVLYSITVYQFGHLPRADIESYEGYFSLFVLKRIPSESLL